jgi:ATP-dependent Clp protease ATP-binding subunit ClpX
LVRILTEPKNALTKQYKKFFEFDGVELEFTDEALVAISQEAMKRGTGARALRMIIEEVMLDVMYEVPSNHEITQVIINEESVRTGEQPQIIYSDLRAA